MLTALSSSVVIGLSTLLGQPFDPLPPLTTAERTKLDAVVDDPAPAVLLNIRKANYNEHYLAGNEAHMELLYPPLKGLGGVYAGVGTDQAYLFIGWMGARFAFLTDYDPWVGHIHRVYAVLFRDAATPEAFLQRWSRKQRTTTLKLLKAAGLPRATINIFTWGRSVVEGRLRFLYRRFSGPHRAIPTFITSQTHYDYVRTMVIQGRIRPMLGNLLDDEALKSVGAFCKGVGMPLRAFYISNAEQYWPRYTPHFRANMAAQWVDERSLLVRTLASQPQNGGFRYIVQPFKLFQSFTKLPWVRRVDRVVPRVTLKRGQFRLERLEQSPRERKSQWDQRRSKQRDNKKRLGK